MALRKHLNKHSFYAADEFVMLQMSHNTLYELFLMLCIVLGLHVLYFYYFFGIFIVILTSIWIHGKYVCMYVQNTCNSFSLLGHTCSVVDKCVCVCSY